MPGLIRWAAHPLAAPLLDGRTLHTHWGDWQLQRSGAQLQAVCAPCRLQIAALGPAPLQVSRARCWRSTKAQGVSPARCRSPKVRTRSRCRSPRSCSAAAPICACRCRPLRWPRWSACSDTTCRKRRTVQVTGTLAFIATARWPEGTWQARPVVQDFSVAGLDTEKLLAAQLPPACRTSAGDGTPLTGWLPRALVAAEDARFYEHPGYEIDQLLAAGQHNQRDGAPLRGASTLTQQLAKLTITGDDRSAARKLRELLYAVEMERTLGKARILQMYLALAPWGDGVCGAERAAQVYLGKSASKVGPVSAAWLVSLLRNPDAQLRHYSQSREIDRERVRQIVAGMRPMSAAQRALANEQMQEWLPTPNRSSAAARWRSAATRTPRPAARCSWPRTAPPRGRCGPS